MASPPAGSAAELSPHPAASALTFSRSAPTAPLALAEDSTRRRQLTADGHAPHALQHTHATQPRPQPPLLQQPQYPQYPQYQPPQHLFQQRPSQPPAAAAMHLGGLPSLISPSPQLAYLSSPSQPLMSFSPPSLTSTLPLSTASFSPASFSAAFSPSLLFGGGGVPTGRGSLGSGGSGGSVGSSGGSGGADPKSLSRYRVLDAGGGGGAGSKVSDEHLKILATLSQLSQSNGFSSPAQHQQLGAFNPLPLQPLPAHPMHQQQLQHHQQQQQQQIQHSGSGGQPQQTNVSPQSVSSLLAAPQAAHHPALLQQPIPVQPLTSHSSLLNITPPMGAASLLTKAASAAPSQSPPPANLSAPSPAQPSQLQQQQQASGLDVSSISPAVLLHHLQLVLQQTIQQQAHSVQLSGSPSSPSTLSSLQQLQQFQQVGNAVLSGLRPDQLQAAVGVVQQRGASVLPTLLLHMSREDRQHQQQHQQQQQQQQQQQMQHFQQLQQPAAESQLSSLLSPPQHSGLFMGHPGLPHPGQPAYYLSSPHLLQAPSSADGDLQLGQLGMPDDSDPDGSRRRSVSGRLLAGSSCHQCKTRRISAELVYCAQSHVKKGRQRKRQMLAAAAQAGSSGVTGGKQERLCRKKYCARCLPERDTRVLTNSGFLFLSEIEARIEDRQEVLYACYDTTAQSIVYRTGAHIIVDPPARWVDFTHAGTRRMWNDPNDDYGRAPVDDGDSPIRLSLRTTPDHEMYVQLCTRSDEDGAQPHTPRMAGRAAVAPHKMRAEELAPGYECDCDDAGRTCTHGYSHYRMYTGAASGVSHTPVNVTSLSDGDRRSPVVALGLQSEDELAAFLELFGYWLGDGSIEYDTRAGLSSTNRVVFTSKNDRDRVYLLTLLARLHLVRGEQFVSSDSDLRLVVRITESRWFRFFDDEFGVKYSKSRHYDRRLALQKQAMCSTQRSSTSASPVSSTCALSVSASASISLGASVTDHSADGDVSLLEVDPVKVEVEDEDEDALAPVKWFPDWALFRLDAGQLRLMIEGLRQADGTSAAAGAEQLRGDHRISTSSLGFRDQLIHACLHAGYSAYFTLRTSAGEVRGYNTVPCDNCTYTQEEMQAALRVNSAQRFQPVRGLFDLWWVCYSDVVSELLPAQDVRFDGSPCRIRQQATAIATQPADLYDETRDGRVWCVHVEHDDHLIFVQRAHCNASGDVTKVGRAMVVANCIQKFYGENPPAKIGPNGDKNWSCPGCRGLCTCAACKRQQSKRESKKRSLASAQAAAAKEGRFMAGGGSTAGGDSKDGQPPVFSSSLDGVTPSAKHERLDKADSDAVKVEQQSDSGSSSGSSIAETPMSGGGGALAAPLNNSAALEATSTEVSPATTHSTMSTSSSFGTQSNGHTPPTPLTHLHPLSAVVTPAPVYSTLAGTSNMSYSPNMQLSSLASLSSSPLMPLSQSMLYSSAFLSPNTAYTSLSNLPLFPSAFSASPPSSPFTATHLLLPGLSTPHLPVASIGGASSSGAAAAGLDSASNLLALTGPSPITWQRTLRAPPGLAAAVTPSLEQQQQQQQQRTATPTVAI